MTEPTKEQLRQEMEGELKKLLTAALPRLFAEPQASGHLTPATACCGAYEFSGSYLLSAEIKKLVERCGRLVLFYAKGDEQRRHFEDAGFTAFASFRGQYGDYRMYVMLHPGGGRAQGTLKAVQQPEVKQAAKV